MKRAALSASLGGLAGRAKQALPQMVVHQHLRDAASAVRAKNDTGARRHLHAAIASLAPQQLTRHGITDDESHQAAKRLMNEASRRALLVQDAASRDQDAAQMANQAGAIELARRAVGLPSGPAHGWGEDGEGGLPDAQTLFDTRPQPSAGQVADAARESMGLGRRQVGRPDRLDVGGLASALGLA